MKPKTQEPKVSTLLNEIYIDEADKGGSVTTSPLSADKLDPLYQILGLSSQCERWVKQYKQCQTEARDVQTRLQAELEFLQMHYNRVKREFATADNYLNTLRNTAATCLKSVGDNFQTIKSCVEEGDLQEYYDQELIQEFLDIVENQQPLSRLEMISVLEKAQPPEGRIPVEYMDPNLPSTFQMVQHMCISPVAKLETKLAKRI